jgi:gliding motility-associated-like protein
LKHNLYYFFFLLLVGFISFSQVEQIGSTIQLATPRVNDYFGAKLSSNPDLDHIIVSATSYRVGLESRGLVQVYQYDGNDWQTKGNAFIGTEANAQFGSVVDISSTGERIIIVSSYQDKGGGETDNGAIYIYDWNSSTNNWDLNDTIWGVNNKKLFYAHLVPDGNTLIYTSDGITHVMEYSTSWRQKGEDIISGGSTPRVDISDNGNRVIESNSSANAVAGAIYIWDYTPSGASSWTLVQTLNGEDDTDQLGGREIKISGDGETIISSEINWDSTNNEGRVKVFKYTPSGTSSWSLTGIPNDFIGEDVDHNFASSVSINYDGSVISAGTPKSYNGLNTNGYIKIFEYTPTATNSWTLMTTGTSTWTASNGIIYGNKNSNFLGIYKSHKLSEDGNKIIFGEMGFETYEGRVTVLSLSSSPTLAITSNIGSINNSSNPLITFTSSKDTGDFSLDDISVTTGSVSSFSATSSKVYTVNYTPPLNSSGTVTFSVADNAFTDSSGSGNISSTLSISFDTISPTLSSFTHDHDDLIVKGGDTVIFTATFTESMTSSPEIILARGLIREGEVMTATTSSVWTYTFNVPNSINQDITTTVSGTDLFGNYYAGTESLTFRIDNVSPTLTITKPAGTHSSQSVVVTLTYDEAVTGLTTDTAQFQDLTNVASLSLLSASSDGTTYTVLITPAGDGEVILTHKPSFPPVTDIAGNTISSTVSCSFIYDSATATINQITSSMADGTYTDYDGNNPLSDTISVTVSFTESVTVDTTNGSPRLLLNTTPASYVYYLDGSGTATLTFENLVNEQVKADDLNINAFELNGGTIVDLASNTANLTLDYVTSNSINLSDLKDIDIDAENPTISNYSLSDNNNLAPIPTTSVNDGDIATFGFQSDKELLLSSLTVTFTGFTTTITKTVNGIGPFSYEISFTVSSTFPEGDVEIDISATDQVTTTVVPIGNPTGIFTEEAFPDRIRIDRTVPTITSNANLNSNENTNSGPTITASEGVAFSIVGGDDQALLSIGQLTGVLTFSAAPDYEDPIDAGADNTYQIIVKAIDAVGLSVTQTVTIQINDLNDTKGVEIIQTDVQTTESGETATVSFILSSQPLANVSIGLSLSDTSEGSITTTKLIFTPESWNVTQTITITGLDDGIADGDITYQLITTNSASDDANFNGLVIDDITLTNIDDEIDNDGDGFFDYQDAFPNDLSEWLDTDNDGIGNNTDLDDDGDGISDVYEKMLNTDSLDPNDTPSDFNGNGIPDALEDSDGDGLFDDIDLFPLDPTRSLDNDGDGIADTDDNDDDDDGIPDDQDDFPLDSRYIKDTDDDGIPNLIDPDDDGDGYDDGEDVFPLDGTEHEDTDLDGIGNNADVDDDGDGIMDVAEDEFITIKQVYTIEVQRSNKSIFIPISKTPIERKNVGKWKIRKKISGGADRDKFTIKGGEPASPKETAQQKAEESEGYLAFINPPDINNPSDHNKDNIYEVEVSYINTIGGDERVPDPENKGEIKVNGFELNVIELKSNPIPLEEAESFEITSDLDADSINNSLDSDDDGDGILSLFEKGDVLLSEEDVLLDTDGDEYVDFQDPDDDNDGVFTQFEKPDPNGDFNPADAIDSDGDGTPDYLDSDDDGDGIDSFNERADQDLDGDPSDALDFDNDGTPDYLDTDDDNDGLSTKVEGLKDTDGDGTPDYHDTDDDNDGVPTLFELDGFGNPLDTDGNGIIDAIDTDDDGDGLLTTDEDLNGNGDPRDDDTDSDGTPNYLESSLLDQDEDGVVDQFDTVDDDPYNDQDGDGYPNLDETIAGSDPLNPNSLPQAFENPALRASIDIVSFFSPNSDGINDTWQIKEIDRYPNSQVWIFTRTGYEVFNTQNYRNDWSGTKDGTPLPEGSYYYRIDLDGNSTVDFEGWLYLTR